jgi:hypothetical protein
LHPSSWPAATANIHFENVYHHLRMLDLYLLGQWDTTSTSTMNESAQTDDHEVHKPATIAMNSARSWLANALVSLGICAEIHSGGTSLPFLVSHLFDSKVIHSFGTVDHRNNTPCVSEPYALGRSVGTCSGE